MNQPLPACAAWYYSSVIQRWGRLIYGYSVSEAGPLVARACMPLLSAHFNLTVELPLKAIVRGYSYEVLPISWRQREAGVSSLRLQEMGSRYLFIVLYLWLEKCLTRGDYRRPAGEQFAKWRP